jgi:hypothetical protein
MVVGFDDLVATIAAIGTIIQLSEIVFEYIRKTAGASDQKKALLLEISASICLLKELKSRAESHIPEWANTLELMRKPDGPLKDYESALNELQEKLRPSNNPFGKVSGRFVWYFRKGEMDDILSKISRSKSNFNTLLTL